MRPTTEQLKRAAIDLSAIPYYPGEPGARSKIMEALERFVQTGEQLEWLIDTAVDKMRQWSGVAELRGLYCTRFTPLDGKEEICTLSGFRPSDCEAEHQARYLPSPERKLLTEGEIEVTAAIFGDAELQEKVNTLALHQQARDRRMRKIEVSAPDWLEKLT